MSRASLFFILRPYLINTKCNVVVVTEMGWQALSVLCAVDILTTVQKVLMILSLFCL